MKKNFLFTFLALFLLLWSGQLTAQTFETGALLGAEYEMKIMKGWHWGVGGQLRFDHNFTQYNRAKVSVSTDYTFWQKRVKIGVGYGFLNYHNEGVFDNRHRIQAALTLSQKFGNAKLAYRAQFQSTFRDNRRGDYRFNPKTYMRNRLTFSYKIPETAVKLHVSEEFWWRLYHPGNNIIDDLRTELGVEYAINKRHTLDFYLRSQNEVQVSNPRHIIYIGVNYGFK